MPDRNARTDLQTRVLEDQVELVYRGFVRVLAAAAAAHLLLLFGLWGAVPTNHLLSWFGISFGFVILRCFHYLAYRRYYPGHPEHLILWRNLMFLGFAIYGLLWSMLGIFLFPHESLPHQVLLSFTVIAMASGSAVTYSPLRGGPELFFVPTLAPLIIQFLFSDLELGWLISVVMLIFLVSMIALSNLLHHTFRRAMELNRRNEELLGELQVSEEKFRGLVENATDSIVLVQNEHIVYANQATEFLSGYTQVELLQVPITVFMADSQRSRDRIYTAYQHRISGEEAPSQYEAQVKRKGGEMLDVLVSSAVVHFPEGPGVIAMIKDITEIKKIERLKSDLVGMVSHEIRTPITAIQSSLEAIWPEVEQALPKEVQEIFSVARTNAQQLSVLVNDIKDFDKLESARMGYRMKRHSVSDLVTQAVASNRPLAESQGITLDYLPGADPLEAWCDFSRLVQVLDNLISNALKYAAPQSPITIESMRNGGWIRVSVANRGPGIPLEFQERIFLPFSQADPQAEHRGSGLGLSICKTIIEDHNGYIGFESKPGDSTTFYFLLPE